MLSNHDEVRKWVEESADSGHKWVVSVDEPWWGKRPGNLADLLRKEVIWGAALAGGHMEFYAGKDDVKHIDYSSYEDCWKAMGHAAAFMNAHLAKGIAGMKPNDDLVAGKDNWAMADEGRVVPALFEKWRRSHGGFVRGKGSGVLGAMVQSACRRSPD